MKQELINGKCAKVVDRCKDLLVTALANSRGNMFDMLDPLVSDNQCHIHSLLLLNILLKCYKTEGCSYDVNRLSSSDIEILSFAVLCSYFKAENVDKFNFVVREVSLDNFCNCFDSKKTEKRFLASVKAKFNSESVRFVKSLATNDVKLILEACTVTRVYSGREIQLLPSYPTMFPICTYLIKNNLPILILLQRLEREFVDSELKYKLHSTEVLYFKLKNGKYRLCDDPNDIQIMQPTIAFSCYCCYAPTDKYFVSKFGQYIDDSTLPSKTFFKNCDIINLLMMSLSDYQLPISPQVIIPNGYDNAKIYAETIYKNISTNSVQISYGMQSEFDLHSTNIYEKYIGHYNLGLQCNMTERTQYCQVVNGGIKRTDQNILFSIVHVYVSNYERECCREICVQNSLGQTGQYETLDDFNKDSVTMDALRTLGFDL